MSTKPTYRNPRDLVRSALRILKTKDYRALAELCDPISLRAFKAQMVDEYCGDYDSSSPGEAALPAVELTDEQYEEWCDVFDPVKRVREQFPDLTGPDELVRMEPVEVFACWLRGNPYDRYDDQGAPWQKGTEWKRDSGESAKGSGWPDYEIIGCAFGSPDIAHVLYRNRLSATDVYGDELLANARPEYREFMAAMHNRGDPMFVTCRRQNDGSWMLIGRDRFMLFGSLEIIELHTDD